MTRRFSPKQWQAVTWWTPGRETASRDAIICDGAVRSGKTYSMTVGFFLWAMLTFQGQRLGLCGQTAEAVWRNVLAPVLPELRHLGFRCREQRSRGRLMVRLGQKENAFYIFGGCNEAAAGRIQGITLAGVLLDETAVLPRSFVEQACARCSVEGSRLWFNCNPQSPQHWFYREWIEKLQTRNCLYLHFTMEDNPSLTDAMKKRYDRMYSGVFRQRYVLGQWVAAEGLVYDFFRDTMVQPVPEGPMEQWYISCDYGTVNPASFGLWGRQGRIWYRVQEFYFDSRREGRQMTDREYADALRALAGDRKITAVIADPSAASFLELLRREGWTVRKGKNDVLDGIRVTADLLKEGRLVICEPCTDCLRELSLYVWGEGDSVRKENDHAMDDMRYFAATVVSAAGSGGVACAVRR